MDDDLRFYLGFYGATDGTLFEVRDPLHVFLRIPQKTELAGLEGLLVGINRMFGEFRFVWRCHPSQSVERETLWERNIWRK